MGEHSTELPRVRVAVVVTRGDELLLVRHRKKDRTYWLVPGGGLDYGESIAECATRELREETGLEIEVKRHLYLSEAIAPDKSRHIVNLFVLAEVTGGTLTQPEEEAIEEVAFMPFAELEGLTMYPAIQPQLVASWREGFGHEMRYLGAIWT